ncbi:testis-specific Y-encoded protein 3-like [Ursus americanus]|uniref:testis-specific Y-encoded protein 3-like n=1 Tax=Ursus americanus TaxID=9643 RepID=UPI001E67A9A6|nr:testis-specific Y-encoded protein 3-like [Ursus americanus]
MDIIWVYDLKLVLQLAILVEEEEEEKEEDEGEEVEENEVEDEEVEDEDVEEAEEEEAEEEGKLENEEQDDEEEKEAEEEEEWEEAEEMCEEKGKLESEEEEEAEEEVVDEDQETEEEVHAEDKGKKGGEEDEAEEAGEEEKPEEEEEAEEVEDPDKVVEEDERGLWRQSKRMWRLRKGRTQMALGALQSELEPVNKQASRSYSRLKLKSCQRRQRHLEHRSAIIRGIPGFWAKAFVNHPQMSAMISEQDEGILGYLTDLKVEELRFPRECRQILLFFRKNSYFRNEVVVKEYVVSAAGYGPSHSPPIQWHQDFEREAHSRRHHNSSLNFFNWFSDHSFAGASRIAEIIMDDLWPNPLQYYVSKKAAGEGTERTTGEEPRAWAPRRVLSGSLGPGLHKGRH